MGDRRPLGFLPYWLSGSIDTQHASLLPVTDGPQGASFISSLGEEVSCCPTHIWSQCGGYTFPAQGTSMPMPGKLKLEGTLTLPLPNLNPYPFERKSSTWLLKTPSLWPPGLQAGAGGGLSHMPSPPSFSASGLFCSRGRTQIGTFDSTLLGHFRRRLSGK